MTDRDGLAKNIDKMRADWRSIREGWRFERATQSGWTHEYVQRCVTAARRGPYLVGHVDAVGYPLMICLSVWGWLV